MLNVLLMMLWGKKISQNDRRLKAVLVRCREKNLTLNREKCQIQRTEITYVGHLTADGLKPDPEKICAIQSMPELADKPAVMRFMGMVQY